MIEYTYTDKSVCPPGEWKYKHPTTGISFKGYDYGTIKKAYVNHCLANNLPLTPDWEEQFLSDMCKQNPKWGQKCIPTSMKRIVRRRLSLQAVLAFLNMMKSWAMKTLTGQAAFVTQGEAERRAEICTRCPNNVTLQFSCGACMAGVLTLINGVLGDRKTSLDNYLGACLTCSCALKAAVHVPLNVQHEGLTDELKEDFKQITHCWKREGL
jgi:hypothetical protein